MKYRMVSRDTRTVEWEPSEFILTGEELDKALHDLIRTTAICNFGRGASPVFIRQLGPREMIYISFEEIK